MQTFDLQPEQVQHILALSEGHFIELKSIGVSPAKLTQSLSAFSTADGGELYVGIDEDQRAGTREWRGFDDAEAANGHIQAFEEVFPARNGRRVRVSPLSRQ